MCRRQSTAEIAVIVTELARGGLRLHGFGVKTGGLHLYGHQYSPTDARSLRPPYFHQQTPADHEACCLTCVNVGARRRNRFRSVLVALPSTVFDSSPVGGPNTPESNMRLYRYAC